MSTVPQTFADKVIIITGATSGIGRSTAIAFAEQGASVVVAGRRESEGAETVAAIEKAGGKGLFVRTDVSVEADVAALVARTVEKFGKLDFAFNNAGCSSRAGRSRRSNPTSSTGRSRSTSAASRCA